MKEDKDILKQIAHHDGMTVPDGYFADFASRMADSLPVTEFERTADPGFIAPPRTFWQKVRPYVYMAAMFGGVWCMLKLFTMLTSTPDNVWEPSPVMAEALNNEIFVNEYIIDNVSDIDLMEEMIDNGFDLTSFSQSDGLDTYDSSTSDSTISI